jgi:hypothetical protein
MQHYARLREEGRTKRRSVADALDVVRLELGLDEIRRAEISIGPLQLPNGKSTDLVAIVFPDLGCIVSLPTSDRFRARREANSRPEVFEISALDGAEVYPDGRVQLADGTRLRAVEVVPTYLPYKPSDRDERILRHVISLTNSHYCYRSLREDLPPDFPIPVPEPRGLDYSRVWTIKAPPLKVIRAYIEDNDPELKVSNQKIADALATFGVRVPRRRPRTAARWDRADRSERADTD